MDWATLPHYVVLWVAQWLPPADRGAAAASCRRWAAVGDWPALWDDLTVVERCAIFRARLRAGLDFATFARLAHRYGLGLRDLIARNCRLLGDICTAGDANTVEWAFDICDRGFDWLNPENNIAHDMIIAAVRSASTETLRRIAARYEVPTVCYQRCSIAGMFSHTSDYDAFCHAAELGRTETAQWISFRPGFDQSRYTSETLMIAACKSGRLDMVEWMLGFVVAVRGDVDWAKCIKAAAASGGVEVVDRMLNRIVFTLTWLDLDAAIDAAIAAGHLAVVECLVRWAKPRGAAIHANWAFDAAKSGHLAIAQFLYSERPQLPVDALTLGPDFVKCSLAAARQGHTDCLSWILNIAPNESVPGPMQLFQTACVESRLDTAKMLWSRYCTRLRGHGGRLLDLYKCYDLPMLLWLVDIYGWNVCELVGSLNLAESRVSCLWLLEQLPSVCIACLPGSLILGRAAFDGDIDCARRVADRDVPTAESAPERDRALADALTTACGLGRTRFVQWFVARFASRTAALRPYVASHLRAGALHLEILQILVAQFDLAAEVKAGVAGIWRSPDVAAWLNSLP
jgi:hypothetical protein